MRYVGNIIYFSQAKKIHVTCSCILQRRHGRADRSLFPDKGSSEKNEVLCPGGGWLALRKNIDFVGTGNLLQYFFPSRRKIREAERTSRLENKIDRFVLTRGKVGPCIEGSANSANSSRDQFTTTSYACHLFHENECTLQERMEKISVDERPVKDPFCVRNESLQLKNESASRVCKQALYTIF